MANQSRHFRGARTSTSGRPGKQLPRGDAMGWLCAFLAQGWWSWNSTQWATYIGLCG